jgi:hypothetical protein
MQQAAAKKAGEELHDGQVAHSRSSQAHSVVVCRPRPRRHVIQAACQCSRLSAQVGFEHRDLSACLELSM